MALDKLTKIDGGGISTTSDYRVGVITATKFVGPFEGTITSTDATFSGNVSIGGTLTYEDVTNIDSVGIITAQKDIHVGAGISAVGIITGQFLMASGGSDANKQNVKIGWMNSENLSTGQYNVIVGRRAGEGLNTGSNVVLIGANAGYSLTDQSGGVFIGNNAGNLATKTNNIYIGSEVARYTTSAEYNVIIGTYAGIDNQGNGNTLVGYYAGRGASGATDGHSNTFIGSQVGMPIRGGDNNTGVGFNALRYLQGGNYNTALGDRAGEALLNGSSNIFIGKDTGKLVTNGSNNIILGNNSQASSVNATNEIIIGNNGSTDFKIAGIGVTFATSGNIIPYNTTFNNDIDVDGHTNLDNVSIAGVTTSSGIIQAIQFKLGDNAKAVYGNSADMEIYHNATNSLIQNGTGTLQIVTSSDLYQQAASNITFNTGGSNERLRITSTGELVFAADTDTFIDHPNANQIEITAGNIEVATFIDGQSNRPAMLIDKGGVNNTTGGANYNSNGNSNDLVVGNVSSGNHGITICSPSNAEGNLNYSDGSGGGADAYRGTVGFNHSDEKMIVRAKTGKVVLRNDATDTLVASAGLVGIGTDNPQEKLDVSGNANITGTLKAKAFRFGDSHVKKISVDYFGASYLVDGEYQEILTITPSGNSQNYSIIGKITAHGGSQIQTIDVNIALRSNTRPDLDIAGTYTSTILGSVEHITPRLLLDETSATTNHDGTTGSFKLFLEVNNQINGSITANLDVITRGEAQLNDIVVNTTSGNEVTTLPSGYAVTTPTKIYQADDGVVAFDSDVGISVTNPDEKLHVSGNIKLTGQLFQSMPTDYWAQSNTFIELNGMGNLTHMGSYETCLTSNGYRNSSTQWTSYAINSTTGASQIRLNPQGHIIFGTESNKANGSTHTVTERLRIQSTGVVNIGDSTASSLGDRLLQIGKTDRSGTYIELRTSTSGVGGIVMSDGTDNSNTGYRGTIEYAHGSSNSDSMYFKTAAVERLRIDSSGKLGVGDFSSTSISQALHVRGSQPEIYLEHTGGYDLTFTTNDGMGQCGINPSGGFLSLAANNKNIVMCRTGGFVGINSTAPNARLDVFGTNGTIAVFGDSRANTFECIKIKNDVAGYPAITNDSTPDTLDLRSFGSVQATIDSNNNSGATHFRVMTNGTGNSGTELFKVDDNGYVTKPANPMFKARMSASRSMSSSGWHKIQFDTDSATECFDVGSNYDASTHRFTAPVTGYYHFGCNQRFDAGNGNYFRLVFYKNGSAGDGYAHGHSIYRDGDGFAYVSLNITGLIQLDVNEYVEAWAYSHDDTAWTLQRESQFYGYLVG